MVELYWVIIKEIGLKENRKVLYCDKAYYVTHKRLYTLYNKNKVRKTRRLHTMIREINIVARIIYKQGFSL